MLVESLRIAASALGREMICDQEQSPDRLLVRIPPVADLPPDPLVSFLTIRSVDRRAYRWRGLQPDQKALLDSSVGGAVALDWHEHAMARWRCARLNAMATDIRLRCPEAFPIHQRVIDWQQAFSADRIPARAVGLAGPVLPMLRWALKDWRHMQRINRLGTVGTAAQLDYLPGLGSAGFVVFRRPAGGTGPLSFTELIECGRAIQRFWLTVTRLGLVMQPTLAMLAFAEYRGKGRAVHGGPDPATQGQDPRDRVSPDAGCRARGRAVRRPGRDPDTPSAGGPLNPTQPRRAGRGWRAGAAEAVSSESCLASQP